MAQPFDRDCKAPAPGELDQELEEFWVDDPWQIQQSNNLSSFEKNRIYLNHQGSEFMEISHLTAADSDGDGRSVVAADFRNNGHLDLVVRQVGGGPLLLYENNFQSGHYLTISLRGRTSNRLGIGSRLIATIANHKVVRELYPLNSFRSQMTNQVHFGLGKEEVITELEIKWPSGENQIFKNIQADRHIILTEGNARIETIQPGSIYRP